MKNKSRLKTFWSRIRGKKPLSPLAEQVPVLNDWFASDVGLQLLKNEQAFLRDKLPDLFGYHLLQMSVADNLNLHESSSILHRFNASPQVYASEQSVNEPFTNEPFVNEQCASNKVVLSTNFESLPLEKDSVDVVILHHVLEYSENPHQVLKEVSRVLIPRGHLLIIGFNPYSLLGLWKVFAYLFSPQGHWQYKAIVKRRLLDWFKLLDLDCQHSQHLFYRPPFPKGKILQRLRFMEALGSKLHLPLGGVYTIVARKDIHGVTPVKMQWNDKKKRAVSLSAVRTKIQSKVPLKKDDT